MPAVCSLLAYYSCGAPEVGDPHKTELYNEDIVLQFSTLQNYTGPQCLSGVDNVSWQPLRKMRFGVEEGLMWSTRQRDLGVSEGVKITGPLDLSLI